MSKFPFNKVDLSSKLHLFQLSSQIAERYRGSSVTLKLALKFWSLITPRSRRINRMYNESSRLLKSLGSICILQMPTSYTRSRESEHVKVQRTLHKFTVRLLNGTRKRQRIYCHFHLRRQSAVQQRWQQRLSIYPSFHLLYLPHPVQGHGGGGSVVFLYPESYNSASHRCRKKSLNCQILLNSIFLISLRYKTSI